MKVNYEIEVTGSAVWVRLGPGKENKPIKLVYKGDKLHGTEINGNWIKHEFGWSSFYDDYNKPILNVTKKNDVDVSRTDFKPATLSASLPSDTRPGSGMDADQNSDNKVPTDEEYELMYKQEQGDFDKGYTPFLSEAASVGDSFVQNVRGIHGMPYQYMASVDRKLPNSAFGRTFANKILARMPLLILSPGRPRFMSGYSNSEKKGLLAGLINEGEGLVEKIMNKKDGKLYTFEYAYKSYYDYVNQMCQQISRYLGIQDEVVYGQKLGNFKWDQFTNEAFRNFVSSKESVAFYIDSDSQISDSFSNSIGESLLTSKINEASEMGQELQYLLGGFGGATGWSKQFDKLRAENYDKTIAEFDKFTNKYNKLLPENLLKSMTHGLMTVISGGKMLLPEIWKDSDYSTSYDISIKLRTPDCDNLSIFLNLFVPLAHLIAFVAPQQMGSNGYRSPFLVRGYYKGFFNCNMGIITSMNINRGDKEKWTINGLPTEIDINFTIKDLYSALTLTLYDKKLLDSFSNTSMMDYLANLCGININKPDIRRIVDLFFMNIENKFTDLITFNRFLGVQQSITNFTNELFRR